MKSYQSLQQLLNEETPHVRIASEKDNQAILGFYHQSSMSDKNQSIKYGRSSDFFAFLKERSDKYLVLTIWDDHQQLQGVGVISYRSGFIHHEETIVGYLGDLRVNLNRKLIREWRKLYSLLIKHSPFLPETFHCKFYQTVIIDQNTKAKSTLVETKIPDIRYELLEKYKMINIIGKINLFSKNHFSISTLEDNNFDEIAKFLQINDKLRNFGRNWIAELSFRLTNWNTFSKKDIFIIRNLDNQIIAVTSVWNPIASKQVIVSKVPLIFKLLVPILNLLPLIEFKPLPKENTPIDILYLNQFVFSEECSCESKKEILNQMINYVFKYKFTMLAYADFESQNLLNKNFRLITNQIPMSMYTVHSLNEHNQIIDPIVSDKKNDPGFDMVLV